MTINHFDRSALPPAGTFYRSELGELGRADRKGWAKPKAGCPFHDSKSKKSFSVNVEHGGFFCFGCQSKGGDVVAFVMQRDRVSFQRAAQRLGAWRDMSAADQQRMKREQADREQMRARTAQLQAEKHNDLIATRDLLHTLERTQDQVSKELARLERSSPGVESRTKDQLLISLVMLCDQIREADADYRRLAGLAQP